MGACVGVHSRCGRRPPDCCGSRGGKSHDRHPEGARASSLTCPRRGARPRRDRFTSGTCHSLVEIGTSSCSSRRPQPRINLTLVFNGNCPGALADALRVSPVQRDLSSRLVMSELNTARSARRQPLGDASAYAVAALLLAMVAYPLEWHSSPPSRRLRRTHQVRTGLQGVPAAARLVRSRLCALEVQTRHVASENVRDLLDTSPSARVPSAEDAYAKDLEVAQAPNAVAPRWRGSRTRPTASSAPRSSMTPCGCGAWPSSRHDRSPRRAASGTAPSSAGHVSRGAGSAAHGERTAAGAGARRGARRRAEQDDPRAGRGPRLDQHANAPQPPDLRRWRAAAFRGPSR